MSETQFKAGDNAKITRPTFLHQGVFIHQNRPVTVAEVNDDEVIVNYLDQEGNIMRIGLKPEELAKTQNQ